MKTYYYTTDNKWLAAYALCKHAQIVGFEKRHMKNFFHLELPISDKQLRNEFWGNGVVLVHDYYRAMQHIQKYIRTGIPQFSFNPTNQ